MFLKSNWTGTCAVTKKYRQVRRGVKNKKKEREDMVGKEKTKSFVMLGPTGQLVLSANI